MARIYHPLLMLLARATQAEMAQMVDYLKTENRILRAKLPKRVDVTAAERQRLPAAPALAPQSAVGQDNGWNCKLTSRPAASTYPSSQCAARRRRR
jgi:hypothetical protein